MPPASTPRLCVFRFREHRLVLTELLDGASVDNVTAPGPGDRLDDEGGRKCRSTSRASSDAERSIDIRDSEKR